MKLDGGPFAGRVIVSRLKPPERIVVFETQMAAPGTTVYMDADAPTHPIMAGDTLYQQISVSSLIDNPPRHKNVMAGAAYAFVRGLEPQEDGQGGS